MQAPLWGGITISMALIVHKYIYLREAIARPLGALPLDRSF
jgi:hypothetical protein